MSLLSPSTGPPSPLPPLPDPRMRCRYRSPDPAALHQIWRARVEGEGRRELPPPDPVAAVSVAPDLGPAGATAAGSEALEAAAGPLGSLGNQIHGGRGREGACRTCAKMQMRHQILEAARAPPGHQIRERPTAEGEGRRQPVGPAARSRCTGSACELGVSAATGCRAQGVRERVLRESRRDSAQGGRQSAGVACDGGGGRVPREGGRECSEPMSTRSA